MKTVVVPAQITSVEDRIAGNFTFSQVLLLIIPLLIGTGIYVGVMPRSDISTIKGLLVGVQFLFFGTLAIRFNGKILAQWLVVYSRFFFRPRYYSFTKNDLTSRDIVVPQVEKEGLISLPSSKVTPNQPFLSFSEQMRVNELLDNAALTVSFELAKKGGIDVSLTPVKD